MDGHVFGGQGASERNVLAGCPSCAASNIEGLYATNTVTSAR